MRRGVFIAFFVFAMSAVSPAQQPAAGLDLRLPTENDALYTGDGEKFYQFIDRDVNGVKTTPWEGGQYGFVRDPVETAAGLVYTRFHEGVDIKPMERDAQGMPLDKVRAIAEGTVVHANDTPGFSNYGRYVVIDHKWSGCHYYSLYAHLNVVTAHVGQHVTKGDPIGVLGFTGEGLDMRRAHVHFEINLMLSSSFDAWHQTFHPGEVNHHGNYNGINLAGFNVARFYLALKRNPSLTVPEFLSHEEVYYRVIIPDSPHFDLLRFYPWMLTGKPKGNPVAWEISFTQSGVPLHITPVARPVTGPELSWIKVSPINYSMLTRDIVTGSGSHGKLSVTGQHLMKLLTSPD
ncbi:MAG: M23 family metallopeptidase [Chthoniobacteraceae bacterium]